MRSGRRQSAQHRVSIHRVFDSYLSIRGDSGTGLEKGTEWHSRHGEQKLQSENHSGDGKLCRKGQNWKVRRKRLENKQSAEFRALGVLGSLEGFCAGGRELAVPLRGSLFRGPRPGTRAEPRRGLRSGCRPLPASAARQC